MDFPGPIRAYLDADRRGDADALAHAFATDAVVRDKGRTHAGRPAIAAWWREAKAEYGHTVEPLGMDVGDGATTLRARVTGRFPGSPATLAFAFRLRGSEITHLAIGA